MKTLFNSYIVFLILVLSCELSAQSNYDFRETSGWTFSTSLQVTGGSYFYDEYSTLYFLYGGIRYHNNNFSFYGYIPVVAQNRPGFTQSGMMIIPTGRENEGQNGMMNGGNMHGGNNSMMNTQISLGDFYLYGSYQLLNEYDSSIDLFVNPNIKFPTSSASSGIGTGRFDYSLSINVRRSIESFVLLAEAGFIKLGDPDGIDYKNPFTYGIGLGKFLSENGNSILLYFYSYTKILDNYEPPRQVSAGLNFKLDTSKTLILIGSKGLSNYSPDFSISGGLSFNL